MSRLADYLPILDWGRRYSRATLTNDMVAAIIVTIMLIPQSLAYAMLAGLPAEIGLYASILPLVAGKLILHPLIVFVVMAYVLRLDPFWVKAGVL